LLTTEKSWFENYAAEKRCGIAIGFAVRIDDRPIGVTEDRLGIPHSRIMHVKRDSFRSGHLAPDPQWIPDEPRGWVSHFGGVTRKPAVALAIDLQVIGMHQVDDVLHHRRCRVLADLFAVWTRVEIEMNPQEAVRPQEALGRLFRRILGQESGWQQNGHEDSAKSCFGLSHPVGVATGTLLDTKLGTPLIGRLVRGLAFLPAGEPRRQRDERIPQTAIHRSCLSGA